MKNNIRKRKQRQYGLWTIACGLLILLVQSSFRDNDPEAAFRALILIRANTFTKQLGTLNAAAGSYANGTGSIEALRAQLAAARRSYKGIEYIVEYYYPEHTKEYLNGPPLFHIDPYPHTSGAYYALPADVYVNSMPLDYLDRDHYRDTSRVIAPRGLQVLDELVFSADTALCRNEILPLVDELSVKWNVVVTALTKRKYFRRFEILEAARLELIRIFTLGVTGFDTPGSLNALPETQNAIEALEEITRPLLKEVPHGDARFAGRLFKDARHYLDKHHVFDTFDRLAFLKEYINPLYASLMEVHTRLKLPSTMTLDGRPVSWNVYSRNIFAEDFLDPYYYTLLKRDKDSDSLRILGKKLFYDTRISRSGQLSCGSCHQPEMAFTDGKERSFQRNAPGLINAVYADRYFYDLRAFDLEDQAGHVIRDHQEFDTDFPALLRKLNEDTVYLAAFNHVFHSEGQAVTRSRFSTALSSYVMSLRSFNSPFDQYVRGERTELPEDVKQGFNLFMGKAACGTCHYAPSFSGLVPPLYHESESEVLGVLTRPGQLQVDGDAGRTANKVFAENVSIYLNAFKTVSVRNAGMTAPYFHNGAYPTLESVIDFYDAGGAAGKGLGNVFQHQTLAPDSLHLSGQEKQALIAFLQSLTDSLAIKKFSAQ